MKHLDLAILVCGALALVPCAPHAQLALQTVDRDVGCDLHPQEGASQFWYDQTLAAGPYLQDFDVVVGAHHLRSLHDSAVIADGSTLTVAGTFVGSLASTAPEELVGMISRANLTVAFVPDVVSTVALEAQSGWHFEVFFLDQDDAAWGINGSGPGTVTFADVLAPGRTYVFQIFYSLSSYQGEGDRDATVTFSLTVAPGGVGTKAASFGTVKAIFR